MTASRYTPEEDQIIRNMKRNEIKEVAKRFGRSQFAVSQRRQNLLNPEPKLRPHKPAPRKPRGKLLNLPFARPEWFDEDVIKLATSARN